MRNIVPLLSILAFACTPPDQGLTGQTDIPPTSEPGAIKGRVCDPSGRTWLPDALAYVNIVDDEGFIKETRQAYSDIDGRWELGDLPGDFEYTVYVQFGAEVLSTDTIFLESGDTYEFDEPDCFDPLTLDVAVVTGDYDDFDQVLNQMGFANFELVDGLDQDVISTFLNDPDTLARFDIIFFNGGFVEEEVIYNTENPTDQEVAVRVQNVRDFVENGGSLYASDWAYDLVELGWPESVNFLNADEVPDDAQQGDYNLVTAAVSDSSLSEFLGTQYIEIDYDLPVWPPVESVESNVSVHLRGDVEYSDGLSSSRLASSPLLLSFNAGNGKVVFSTFRVARNASQDMVETLQYMMYNL